MLEMTTQQLSGLSREVGNWDGDVVRITLKEGPLGDAHVRLKDATDGTLDQFTLRRDGARFESVGQPA